jgi:hypothetical protein
MLMEILYKTAGNFASKKVVSLNYFKKLSFPDGNYLGKKTKYIKKSA